MATQPTVQNRLTDLAFGWVDQWVVSRIGGMDREPGDVTAAILPVPAPNTSAGEPPPRLAAPGLTLSPGVALAGALGIVLIAVLIARR